MKIVRFQDKRMEMGLENSLRDVEDKLKENSGIYKIAIKDGKWCEKILDILGGRSNLWSSCEDINFIDLYGENFEGIHGTVLYVGQAKGEDNLYQRYKQHSKGNEDNSTFSKTLKAVLGEDYKKALNSCYFCYYPFDEDVLDDIEKKEINKRFRPFNIQNNTYKTDDKDRQEKIDFAKNKIKELRGALKDE